MALFIDQEKLTYAPGETGVLKVRFRLGTLSGSFEKAIKLWMTGDAKEAPSVKLGVKITIPQHVVVKPKTLKWERGAAKSTQTLTIQVMQKSPMEINLSSITSANFTVEFFEKKKGYVYELKVTPKDMAKKSLGVLRCSTDSEVKKFKRVQAYLMIRDEK